MNDIVKERPDPYDVDRGYGKTNKIFTFPLDWDADKCIKWCKERNYNPFIFSINNNGACEFTCAYSWQLSYFNQFGEFPE